MKKSTGMLFKWICAVAVLVIAIFVGQARSVYADEYPVWIGDQQVTDDNRADVLEDGTVTYIPESDGSTAKLILNGMQLKTFSERAIGNAGDQAVCGIYTEQSLEVIVMRSNVITVIHRRADVSRCYGIYQKGADNFLRFSGDGTLLVASDNSLARSFGIRAESIVVTEQVTLNVAGGNVTADPTAATSVSYGIYAKSRMRILNDAHVIASAGSAVKSYGVYVEEDVLQIKDQGVLEASGMKAVSLKNNSMLSLSEDAKKYVQVNQPRGEEEVEYWIGDRLEDHDFVLIDAGKGAKVEQKENTKQSNLLKFVLLIGFAILVLIASTVVISVAMITKHKR